MPAVEKRGLFITGTDTGVGKTIFAAAFARFLRNRGIDVGVMKPVESGVTDPGQPGEDSTLLTWAAAVDDPIDLVCPYRLKEPLAPAVAAQREGVKIVPGHIQECYQALSSQHDIMIVEGSGGLMVPVVGGILVADIARGIGLPLLVVARPDLGTINHTFLTTFTAEQMGLPLAGYLINRMPDKPDVACETAPHNLASLISTDLLGVLSEIRTDDRMQMVEQIAVEIEALPTLPLLLSAVGQSQPARGTSACHGASPRQS